MDDGSDAQLLRQYAEHGDEAAFRDIVVRHTDLVYSSALRQVGSPDLARDVAQSVFTDLARKAPELAASWNEHASLLGWLYRSTRYAALNQLRDDRRRQARERQIMQDFAPAPETAPEWEHVRPVLDEAMADLSDEDREALLLRFFKNQDFRAVGSALGVSDDAAQKRVSRALERLRAAFTRRGVTASASALTVALPANAVTLAPAGLAASLSTAALAGTTVTAAASATATKAIAMTTLQKTVITATIIAAAGTGVYEARQASRLRQETRALQQQQAPLNEQLQLLRHERDDLASKLAGLRDEQERLDQEKSELLKLRGEVGALRHRTNDLERLLASMTKGTQTPIPTSPAASEGFFPRESWKFAGHATPEASFQTMTFACSRGDIKAILESYVPEVRSLQEKAWGNQPEAELKDQLINATIDVTGFRIVRKDFVSDDEVFLTVATDGKSAREQKLRLKRINEEWKIDPRQFDPVTRQYK